MHGYKYKNVLVSNSPSYFTKKISNIELFRGKPKVFKLQNGFIIINILFS